jgi:hypothetical protein
VHVIVSTFFGYGTWHWLVSRHPASRVAPVTLLVPVVGIFTASLVRGEHPTWGQLLRSPIVLVGLALALGLVDALARHRVPHGSHVRVAWELSRRYDPEEGLRRLIAGIQGIAARAGKPGVYHETITRFAQSCDPG